ncbi:aminotransferase class V-fold PLP-dependent enzyme [Calothrix sp. UHCC 0171]|uniref:aminotransferase class V-fold PLP-dependent enzyme n=1 Tax=Calothrix sp. UHCC 0171 TaxID=3110245 RepID=UPI002B1F38C5|nr:aminotransferase class V-fold PLP-dependent enzyme [Calothrix sp. UHCC 0171]MEA5573623.1 aminotransferase class V-fold PLP-dependent enzyme [Calothrix sp. UHCC 0171]
MNHRALFPALANKAYFNYGGQGPMPQAAIDAIMESQMKMQQLGPFGNGVVPWMNEQMFSVRNAIASHIQTTPETITLTENVTLGCNIAMWGIDWRVGDNLLLTDCEHHAVVGIAQTIGKRFQVEVTTCPILNANNPVDVIAEYLQPNTRLLVVSHILWNTGQVLELEKISQICAQNHTLLLVDAAQSFGSIPLDMQQLGVDFYAFTGHKWMCGAAGLGGLYVSPQAKEKLLPTFVGWRSVITDTQGYPQAFQADGRSYEIATSDNSLFAALKVAMDIHEQWGNIQLRHEQILKNSKYLWEKLQDIPEVKCWLSSPPESGLVSFQIQNSPAQTSRKLVNFLESQGIFTRTIANPDCIRACVHYFTLESEMDQLVAAIAKELRI